MLWPEHFDIAIRVDDVNYGVSPGDDYLNEPYAYVGVDPVPDDEFWNAPFGAARPLADLVGVEAVTDVLQRRALTAVTTSVTTIAATPVSAIERGTA